MLLLHMYVSSDETDQRSGSESCSDLNDCQTPCGLEDALFNHDLRLDSHESGVAD